MFCSLSLYEPVLLLEHSSQIQKLVYLTTSAVTLSSLIVDVRSSRLCCISWLFIAERRHHKLRQRLCAHRLHTRHVRINTEIESHMFSFIAVQSIGPLPSILKDTHFKIHCKAM